VEDAWKWRAEENGLFSVNSTYILSAKLIVWEDGWSDIEKEVFSYLWKGATPSRVVAFSWKLLFDRIPTRTNFV